MESFKQFISKADSYVDTFNTDSKGHFMIGYRKGDQIKPFIDALVKSLKKGVAMPDGMQLTKNTKPFDANNKNDQMEKYVWRDKNKDINVVYSYRSKGQSMQNDPEMFFINVSRV